MSQSSTSPAGTLRYDFSDRIAIVTGASRGIGAHVALAFAGAGAKVVLHGRDTESLQSVADQVRALGGEAVTVTGNIRSEETAQELAAAAMDAFGRIDILVNNAGGNFAKRLEELSTNAWNATIETNLGGAFQCAKACWPVFAAQNGGVIVNVGSVSSFYAHPQRGAYAAAKAGIVSLTQTMAWEWAGQNIRVNCVAPGAILTDASRFAAADTADKVAAYIPLGRLGTPKDIADACMFLCSDAASYITGEVLTVAGGPLASSPSEMPPRYAPEHA
ncbi:SDR family NAD(P)-dependent oxidoreductase [Nocardia australiensis]|uniref:SDR family NAD(P)-dependent oxidoreductase n=1 Tax=Nocardia australiensis TaxID=2887191 RepID=UPI001D138382|nr:SDR family oxidoreductase [Nocardia australiensis]